MRVLPPRSLPLTVLAAAVLVCVAAWVRLEHVGASLTLQDSVGPFWAAIRGDGRAHASGYGAGLLLPFWALTVACGSLWSALCGMGWFHALIAPIGAAAVTGRSAGSGGIALAVGAILAFDPALVSSCLSGSETYLAPIWIGVAFVVSPAMAWVPFALAVANHPLAICGAPLLLRKGALCRRALPGLIVASLLIGHQALGIDGAGVPGSSVGDAWLAAWHEGRLAIAAMVTGIAVGCTHERTRRGACAAAASIALLCAAGWYLGYLRDHHIRMFVVPAIAGWGGRPRLGLAVLGALALFVQNPARPPEVALRAGTLGLTTAIADRIVAEQQAVTIDRVWFSGGPGAEPAAVMLDLRLRGWGPERIGSGTDMVLVVAGDGPDLQRAAGLGEPMLAGHGYTVLRASVSAVRSWSEAQCDASPKVGGAWDALSVLHPALTTTQSLEWWACSPDHANPEP
ncbi:MAG: hypothetical protein VX127_02800 [Myxococcota bacterium]|nr:hypothetical protein [Myxococcota bacterium]